MNVHISYKISKTPDLEKIINQQVEKLGRYLQVFRPDLVHLKGIMEENSARQGIVVSLNLRLPSGQMASQESSATAKARSRQPSTTSTEQVKRHKELLRSHHKWPRRRGPDRAVVGTVPFEKTVAAVKPDLVSSSDIAATSTSTCRGWSDSSSESFSTAMTRAGHLPTRSRSKEVVDEAIANALSEQDDKPERMKLEAWVHRLAREAIEPWRLMAETTAWFRWSVPMAGRM